MKTHWIRPALLSLASVFAASSAIADSVLLDYDDDLLNETAEEICYHLLEYNKDPHEFELFSTNPIENRCVASDLLPILPKACEDKLAFMGIPQFVRKSIADWLEIKDSATLERQLPVILKKLSHYQCPKVQEDSSDKYYDSMRSFPKLVLFLETNASEFYENLAFPTGPANILIDINAVDCVTENGQVIPETLLDFTIKASDKGHPTLYQDAVYITTIRQRLTDFGAKRGSELDHNCGQ